MKRLPRLLFTPFPSHNFCGGLCTSQTFTEEVHR